jgi:hypothetical protein
MNQKDIENLRLLANNTKHLIEMIMARLCREARETGHDMASVVHEGVSYGNRSLNERWYSYCKKCVYDIDLDCIHTDKGEDKIYIKHTGKGRKCPGTQ